MWWVISAGLLVLGFVAWSKRADSTRTRHQRLEDIPARLEALFQCRFGSVLVIQHEGSERFIQFAQRSDVVGSEHLLYGFPDAPWSRSYFPDLLARLRAENWDYEVRAAAVGAVTRFVEVHLLGERDRVISDAMRLARLTTVVLQLPATACYSISLLGSIDHARYAWENKAALEQQAQKSGVAGWAARHSLKALEGGDVKQDPRAPGEEDDQ